MKYRPTRHTNKAVSKKANHKNGAHFGILHPLSYMLCSLFFADHLTRQYVDRTAMGASGSRVIDQRDALIEHLTAVPAQQVILWSHV